MSKSYRKFMATSLSAALVVSAVGTVSAAGFPDVTEKTTGADQIARLVEAGVLKGNLDGTFKPGENVSRQHAAIYFANSLQLEIADNEIAQYLAGFSDVDASHRYAKEIAATVKAGIFNGNPVGGKFNPANPMSRQHMAVTTVNALGLTMGEGEVNLVDLDSVNPNYREAVEILVSNGIIKGVPTADGKRAFNPNGNVTRGQLAVFLVSSMDTAGVELPEGPKEDPKEEPKVEIAVESVKAINGTETIELSGATNVARNAAIVIKVNEALDRNTVTNNSVKLTGANDTVAATNVTYDAGNGLIYLEPVASLATNTKYTLSITNELKTSLGQSVKAKTVEFTTGSANVVRGVTVGGTPIRAWGSTPAATFPGNTPIVVTFSETVDASTVTTNTFRLQNVRTGEFIGEDDGAITYNGNNRTATFRTAATQSPNEKYRVIVDGVKNLDGTSVASFTREFAIGAPAAATTQLPNGDAVANVYTKLEGGLRNGTYFSGFEVRVTFDRIIDADTVNARTFQIRDVNDNNKPVEGKLTFASNVLTFVPSKDLKDDTTYEIVISRDVKDVNGIRINNGNDTQRTFTTGDFTRPEVKETTPSSGASSIKEDGLIKVEFSEPLNPASVVYTDPADITTRNQFAANRSIVLVNADNVGIDLTGAITLENNNKTIVIDGNIAGLSRNTTYTLKLAGENNVNNLAIRDASTSLAPVGGVTGNALASNFELQFTTRTFDTQAPKLVSLKTGATGTTELTTGQTIVNRAHNLRIEFDEAVQFAVGGNSTVEFTAVNAPTTTVATTGVTAGGDTNVTLTVPQAAQIQRGDRVTLSGTGIAATTRVVTAVNRTTGVITVDGAVLGATADVTVVRQGVISFTGAQLQRTNGNKTIVVPLANVGNELGADRTYRVSITNNVQDEAGNRFIANTNVVQFTTGPRPTATAGRIIADDNSDAGAMNFATGVTTNSRFTVRITDADTAVQDSTVNQNSVFIRNKATGDKITAKVERPTGAVAALGTVNAATDWLITPAGNLSENTEYEIVVTNVRDQVGNAVEETVFSFSTTSTAAPKATVTPADGAMNVATNSKITVVFDQAMDVSRFTTAPNGVELFSIDVAGNPTQVALTNSALSYNTSTKTLTVTPPNGLAANTTYELRLGNQLRGTNNVAFSAKEYSFRTAVGAVQNNISKVVWVDTNDNKTIDANELTIFFTSALSNEHRTASSNVASTAITDGAMAAKTYSNATGGNNGQNVVNVTDSSEFAVGDVISIADAGNAGGALATRVTAIDPSGANTIEVADNVETDIAAPKAVTHTGYAIGASVIRVSNATGLAPNQRVTIGGNPYTVQSVSGNLVTLQTGLVASLADFNTPVVQTTNVAGGDTVQVAAGNTFQVGDSVTVPGNAGTFRVTAINGNVLTLADNLVANATTGQAVSTALALTPAVLNIQNGAWGDATLSYTVGSNFAVVDDVTGATLNIHTTFSPVLNGLLDINGVPFGTEAVGITKQ